jgi:hypothetical protein
VLILRIRRAETALADGRLDEAFGLARAADVAAHRKGQKLIGRLARALVARGQKQLSAGRADQAAADCEKAAALAGALPEVAQLRSAVTEAISARQRLERHRGDVLAAAREHVDHGRLSIGEQCLAGAGDDSARVGLLKDQATRRRLQAQAALERARQALDREDFPTAAVALLEARQAHPTDPQGSAMMTELVRNVCGRAATAIDAGRLDLADSLLQPAIRAGGESIEITELTRFLNGCREVLAGLGNGQPRAAAEGLQRLTAIRPSASWLAQAARDAEQAAERLETLRSGPLGLLALGGGRLARLEDDCATLSGLGRPAELPYPRGGHPARLVTPNGAHPVQAAAANGQLPAKLILHVDGIGSYLVLRDRHISIGPAGSSRLPDIGLLAEPGLPNVAIERTDEDYFVSCDAGVRVNDAPAKRKLLTNGDRITLSPRARARFVLPNAASTSAVLQLAGTRLPSCEARQVILLDREMIVGPGPSAHIRADHLAETAILQVRDGRLFCRSKEPVLVNDRPMDRNAGLPLGARVQVGAVSFVVTAA